MSKQPLMFPFRAPDVKRSKTIGIRPELLQRSSPSHRTGNAIYVKTERSGDLPCQNQPHPSAATVGLVYVFRSPTPSNSLSTKGSCWNQLRADIALHRNCRNAVPSGRPLGSCKDRSLTSARFNIVAKKGKRYKVPR